MDGRTDVRMDGRTFLPGLLGYLSGDDLKTEWWDAGMVVCLGRGADLHMAQVMPLPLTLLLQDIQTGMFTFLILPFCCRLTQVVPD